VPHLCGFTLAFALQLSIKHGETSVRVAEECQQGLSRDTLSTPLKKVINLYITFLKKLVSV